MAIVLPAADDIEDVSERCLQLMDVAGFDVQILSYSSNSPQNITDKEIAVILCREANAKLAKMIAAQPKRLSGFAVPPMVILPLQKLN